MGKSMYSNGLLNCAMTYGTAMGGYWVAKFMLVPFIFTVPMASIIFLLLTAAVPVLGYYFTRQYRNRYCPEGRVPFMQAWIFGLLMYAFAALLVSVAHYVFFRYVDDGAMLATYGQILDQMLQVDPSLADSVSQYREAMDLLASLTPIELTVQLISSNVFYGMIFSLPTALLVSLGRKEKRDDGQWDKQ